MKRFKGLQDYAIYKKDGEPWTQEEYDIVTTAFEDPDPFPIAAEEAKLTYLFYDTFGIHKHTPHFHLLDSLC